MPCESTSSQSKVHSFPTRRSSDLQRANQFVAAIRAEEDLERHGVARARATPCLSRSSSARIAATNWFARCRSEERRVGKEWTLLWLDVDSHGMNELPRRRAPLTTDHNSLHIKSLR